VWIDSSNKLQPPDPSKHVPVQIIFCMKASFAYGFSNFYLTEVGKESEEDQLAPMVLQRLWSLSATKVSFRLPI
jgi:hypothetical protein